MALAKYVVATGPELRCKGWRQESILRLLENNLVNAEDPDNLVIYGGRMQAARDWDAYHAIVRELKRLETNQTLVVQSGKPVGVFETTDDMPLVIIVNAVAAGTEGIAEEEALFDQKLLMLAGMTAGAWQYIGSQGIVQGTYETFNEVARQHFGGSLTGRKILTAGSGGMGGGQPLAGKLAGGVILIADVEAPRLQRRVDEGYLDELHSDVGVAIDRWVALAEQGAAASVGVVANIVTVLDEVRRRGIVPDIVTDQTTTDPLWGYIPEGMTEAQTHELRESDPEELRRRGTDTLVRHVEGMLELQRQGAITFEYGNQLRVRSRDAGVDSFQMGGFIDMFIRPMFCEGIGPFRLMAIDGDPETVAKIDAKLMELFADVPRVTNWLSQAHLVKSQGLPARICWLGHTERTRAALAINQMIADGEITGPVAFSRDHLDAGSVTARYRETENMLDGSDAVADWPLLNAILNGVAGADLTSVNGQGTRSLNSGPTTIADGTPEAAERLRRVMNADTGLGVIRQADAGFPIAVAARDRHGLTLKDD